jgi:hypothetical protein
MANIAQVGFEDLELLDLKLEVEWKLEWQDEPLSAPKRLILF